MAIVGVASIRVRPDLTGFRKELDAGIKAITAEVSVQVNADTTKAKAQVDAFVAKESGRQINQKIDVDHSALDLAGNAFDDFAKKTLRASVVLVGFTAAMAAAKAIGPLLVQAAGAALLLPGALVAVAGIIGTIKLGTDGIKKAFEALKPTLDTLKSSISATFQTGLAPAVNNLKSILPGLSSGFKDVAKAVSGVLVSVTTMLKESGQTAGLNSLLSQTGDIVTNIGKAFAPVISAFLNIAGVGLPIISKMTQGLGDAASRFDAFTASADGAKKIQSIILTSFTAIKQLGAILQQVGGIIVNVFSGLSAGAGNLGGSVLPVLTQINHALGSVQGQSALASLGAAMTALGKAIASTLGQAIPVVLPALTSFFNFVAAHANVFVPIIGAIAVFGPILARLFGLFTALLPALQVVFAAIRANPILLLVGAIVAALAATGQLQPLLQQIGSAFKSILAVAGPVIQQVFGALVNALKPIISAILPVFSQLLAGLVPVLGQLLQALGGGLIQVISALAGPLLQLVQAILPPLLQVFQALVPIITNAATVIGLLLSAAAPLIGLLAQLIGAILPPLVRLLAAIIVPIVNVASAITGGLVSAIKAVVGWFSNLGSNVSSVGSSIGGFFSTIGGFFSGIGTTIANAAKAVGSFFVGIGNGIANGFTSALTFIQSLPGKILRFLSALPGQILTLFLQAAKFMLNAFVQGVEWVIALMIAIPIRIAQAIVAVGQALITGFTNAFNALVAWFPTALAAVITFFQNLPQNIINAVINFGTMLVTWATNAWNALTAFFANAVTNLATFFQQLPQTIINAVINFGQMFLSWATNAWNGIVNYFTTAFSNLVSFFSGLPGRILGAIQSLASSLGSFFRNAWNNAYNAVVSVVGNVVSFIGGLPGKILNAIGNLGSLLFEAGKNVVQGLWNGIKNAAGWLEGQIKNFVSGIKNKVLSLLGIGSPSKWMAQNVGRWIPAGIAKGIDGNASSALDSMSGLTSSLMDASQLSSSFGTNFQSNLQAAASVSAVAPNGLYDSVVGAVATGLSKAQFTIDPSGQSRINSLGTSQNGRR